MLKFFRRIRLRLIDAGNLKKYSFYAFGEIILVVIGILIALQINNWNEARKNRKYEKEYINRLIEDLEHDQEDLASVIRSNSVNLILAEDALRRLGADTSILLRGKAYLLASNLVTIQNEEVSYKDSLISSQFELKYFGHQLTRLTQTREFDLTQTTINELISTGKIEVIKDRSLKKNIQDYYAVMLSHLGNEKDILTPHRRYLKDVLNESGIPPWSILSDSEVQDIINNDHQLIMALYNIYDANHLLLKLNYVNNRSLYKHIQKMKKDLINSQN